MGRRGLIFKIGAVGLGLLLAPCGWAAPIRVRDARGKVIALAGPPRRILSIAPSNTETLYALGLERRVVGVTDFCDYPARARLKPKVGGVVLNMEKIVALKPDLVLAKYDFQKANVERLERLGLRVFAVDPQTVGETLAAILSIGRVTGTLSKAKTVTAGMSADLARAGRIAARDRKRPRVLTIIQRKPLIVVGPRTFMDDALRRAGARNVAADAKQAYPQFSLESAVARKPDVLLLSAAKPQEFYGDAAWRITPAVRGRRVYAPAFMPMLERPGPRLATAVRQLAELLHPAR
jgi:iron complex transport system substrate-binding protein